MYGKSYGLLSGRCLCSLQSCLTTPSWRLSLSLSCFSWLLAIVSLSACLSMEETDGSLNEVSVLWETDYSD